MSVAYKIIASSCVSPELFKVLLPNQLTGDDETCHFCLKNLSYCPPFLGRIKNHGQISSIRSLKLSTGQNGCTYIWDYLGVIYVWEKFHDKSDFFFGHSILGPDSFPFRPRKIYSWEPKGTLRYPPYATPPQEIRP